MKLTLLLSAAALLLYGFLSNNYPTVILGAMLFVATMLSDLILVYRSAKRFTSGSTDTEIYERRGVIKFIETSLEGLIILAGLVTFVIGQDNNFFLIPGAIIWIGSIVIYFIGGVIIGEVAGIPLKFGYGGWYVSRSRSDRTSNRFRKKKLSNG